MAHEKSNKFPFTDERLRRLAQVSKPTFFFDTVQAGLRLLVSVAGTKSFQFQKWSPAKGRPVTLTLGKWPALPITEARERCARLLVEVRDGEDPAEQKRQQRETLTIGEMLDNYMREHSKPHKRSWRDDEGRARNHITPAFGPRRVDDLTREQVRRWHAGLAETMKPVAANRALALLRNAYNVILPEQDNPCRVKMFRETSRDRFLQPDELGRFFQAVEQERTEGNPDVADYILLSLFTGARRANVLAMRWADIDLTLQQWRITAEESKNKTAMIIPFVGEALEILRRRREYAGSVFVFEGQGKSGHLWNPRKGWLRILSRAGLQDVRLHDLRRTMGSYQTIGGASTAIVGKTLGHRNPASTAVYARMTLDPVRDAMEKAVSLMKQAAAMPVEKKVVNLKNKKASA